MVLRGNDVRVRSWADLCERLYDRSWQGEIGRFRSNFACRGLSDERHELATSLMRLGGDFGTLEHHLIRNFSKYALFSAMSRPDMAMSVWLDRHPSLWWRIIIPKEMKWEVRDKLDQANITERMLFPGLDGLASWLKRHYSPKK